MLSIERLVFTTELVDLAVIEVLGILVIREGKGFVLRSFFGSLYLEVF